MLKESFRCLKPSGIYYCITLHEKEKMLEYFEKPDLPWGNILAFPIRIYIIIYIIMYLNS